jgi:putative ABC transport system permease protein
MLMALLGGAAGLALGSWGARALLAAGNGPDFLDVNPDLRVVGYTLTLSIIAGFGFGLGHALQASAPGISTRLKKGRVPWGRGWHRFNSQQLLVMSQISICLVLLISAGSLVRVLQRLQSIDPGIETKSVAVVSFDLRRQGYSNSQAAEFHARIMADLRALPGVESAALTSSIPLSGGRRTAPVFIEGQAMGQQTNTANFNEVSPSFFPTLGIDIVRGRAFSDLETSNDTPVAVISETMARRYWAGEDPLGKRFRVASSAQPFTVLGVAKDIRSVELPEPDGPSFYTLMSNQSTGQIGAKLLVRAKTPDDLLAVRRLLESMEGKPRGSLTHLNANLTRWIEPTRLGLLLAGSFGFVALVLSCIGVYGITAFAVTSRRHEIAVRLAIGAPARRVVREVLRQEMRPVALGIGIGAVLTVPSALLLSKVLYGVGLLDLETMAGVCMLLAVVALMAAAIPAHRVTLVDPLSALRHE